MRTYFLVAPLFVWLVANGHAQTIYDFTHDAQLAGVPGAVRGVDATQAYPWQVADKFEARVKSAGAMWHRHPVVMFDWEPGAITKRNEFWDQWTGSVDPHHATLEAIQRKHQQYAIPISAVTPMARERGVRLFVYDYLRLTHKRLNDIYADGVRYQTWLAEQQTVLSLPVTVDGKTTTLLDLLAETDGGVMVPWYVPAAMNEARFAGKVSTIFTRVNEAIGESAMPLLAPTVAGGDAQVLPEIQRALIAEARKRKEFGVWAKPGEVTEEFLELLTEGAE